ncbi:MAG: AMP-binding protein [Rhizomicrobium sp.]
MLGLMQDWPLLVHKIIDHAAINHGDREVVSRSVEGPIHRTDYRQIAVRAQGGRGAGPAGHPRGRPRRDAGLEHLAAHRDVVRHRRIGAVYHTLNPRLFPDQLVYIANHAEDKVLFFDITFADLVAQLAPRLPGVEMYVALTDAAHLAELAGKGIPNLVAYEEFIAGCSGDFAWKQIDERAACGLCYTSGTTGNPKGVLYSHRSNVLHALMAAQADAQGLSERDTVLPVVPMFHANAWALAFCAPMVGAKL